LRSRSPTSLGISQLLWLWLAQLQWCGCAMKGVDVGLLNVISVHRRQLQVPPELRRDN